MSEDILKHYGTPRHSGRYPWGSGENPYQRTPDFLKIYKDLKDQGLSDKNIADGWGISVAKLKAERSIFSNEQRAANIARVIELKEQGYSNSEIGRRMGVNESTVRSWLKPVVEERAKLNQATVDILKGSIDKHKFIDVGVGVESHLGISRTRLKTAIEQLKEEGYTQHYIKVRQVATGKETIIMVMAPPGTTYSEVYKNQEKISLPVDWHIDSEGRSVQGLKPIMNIPKDTVYIRYAEDGGTDKDGVIELRRGVDHLNLGKSNYAQVRIGVDGALYLKGMAIYSDNVPDGYDLIFNTNKKKGTKFEDVLKQQDPNPDNPFNTTIKPLGQRGAINIVNEEGDWNAWARTISSQVLSKQDIKLIKRQLDISYGIKLEEFDDIMNLTNPTVKRHLLERFSDDCDSSAVHLKAAALPRQASKVILPIPELKETEVYATSFRNGEQVALIRHPHGGIFEIPVLKVNNRNQTAKKILGNPKDAIGINPKVAEQLSGADFDGDTVLVIPTKGIDIRASKPLKALKNFNPKESYPYYEGMKVMTKKATQNEMGKISNLITDMTIKGANFDEIARAVKHSMVVIDANKHKLNYEQSFKDNDIQSLKTKYQGGKNRGSSTLLSKASSDMRVNERKDGYKIDPESGKKIFEETGRSYINEKGKEIKNLTKTTPMYETDDARTLSSGTLVENLYADYANQLKTLANKSRKMSLWLKDNLYSPSARKTYAPQVASLISKLNNSLKNSPLERKAQLLSNAQIKAKKKDNPDMDKDTYKKLKQQVLTEMRTRIGAKKTRIDISKDEWDAIQAGAVTKTQLKKILDNTDLDLIKTLATPRTDYNDISKSKIEKIKSMASYGYTQAEIADAVGVSTSIVDHYIE